MNLKKKFHLITLSLAFLSFINNQLAGQNDSSQPTEKISDVQPTIMVIPFVQKGQDLRTVLEDDINLRIAITKVKEAFDLRGYTTIDFTAKLKAMKDNNIFLTDNQSDLKSKIIEMSGSDIYVQTEVNVIGSNTGNTVTVILTAYDASTGNSLANKVGESGKYYTENIGKLASKAVDSIADDFLKTMNTGFRNLVENGKSILIDISLSEDSDYKLSSVIGSSELPLSDEIEVWISENAFKNYYHIQGVTDVKMIFDHVKIPVKDPETGLNYNTNKFALKFYLFLSKMGLNPKKDVKGNTIYITIN